MAATRRRYALRAGAAAVLLGGLVACGLTFSPGDYEEQRALGGGLDGEADGPTMVDAGLPPVPEGGARALVLAGRRNPFAPNDPSTIVAETLVTTVGPDGKLGTWGNDRPPPDLTTYGYAFIKDGNVVVECNNTAITAPLGERLTGDWKTLRGPGGPPIANQRTRLVNDKGYVGIGGQAGPGASGDVYFAPVDFVDGGFAPYTQVMGSTLMKARGDVTVYATPKFVYAIGGRTDFSPSGTGLPDVDVATLGPDGKPGTFSTAQKMVNPTTMADYNPLYPTVIVAGGSLFVIGGTLPGGAPSDLVIVAQIEPMTGQLSKWKAAPQLPGPLSEVAAFTFGSTLILAGGSGATAVTDAVLSLTINPDGTFGSAWTKVGTLPAARAGAAAVVY